MTPTCDTAITLDHDVVVMIYRSHYTIPAGTTLRAASYHGIDHSLVWVPLAAVPGWVQRDLIDMGWAPNQIAIPHDDVPAVRALPISSDPTEVTP